MNRETKFWWILAILNKISSAHGVSIRRLSTWNISNRFICILANTNTTISFYHSITQCIKKDLLKLSSSIFFSGCWNLDPSCLWTSENWRIWNVVLESNATNILDRSSYFNWIEGKKNIINLPRTYSNVFSII